MTTLPHTPGPVHGSAHGIDIVLVRLRTLVARGAEHLEAVVDLPPSQLAALQAVGDGVTTVSEVARHCLSHVSSASRTIDALVQEGLVDRTTDPEDRRAVVLSLTAEGADRRDMIDSYRHRILDRAMAGFDEEERRQFTALLDRFLVDFEHGLDEAFPDA